MRLLVCTLAFLASCQPATDSATTESRLAVSGQLQSADIDEASGLAASRRNPGVLWVINDDGPAVLYAIDSTGATRGKTRISKAENRDWEDLASYSGQPITIPALFIGGERDGPTLWGAASIEKFEQTLPKLFKSEILAGAGHWIQQERSQRTNQLLLEFLASLE